MTPAASGSAAAAAKPRSGKTGLSVGIVLIAVILLAVLIHFGRKPDKPQGTPQGSAQANDPADQQAGQPAAAPTIYQPAEGEQRFLDILKQLDETKTITIEQGESRVVSLGRSKASDFVAGFCQTYMSSDGFNSKLVGAECVYVKDKPGVDHYNFRWLDRESKLYTYYKDFGSVYPILGFDYNGLPQIPAVLAPGNWTFVSSGTDVINGTEYYCETYTVDYCPVGMTSEQHYSINVAIDVNGDTAFMGETVYDPSPSSEFTVWRGGNKTEPAAKSMEPLMHMFDPREINYGMTSVKTLIHLKYNQYTPIRILPTFDAAKYDISTCKEVPDELEFYEMMSSEARQAIEDEFKMFG